MIGGGQRQTRVQPFTQQPTEPSERLRMYIQRTDPYDMVRLFSELTYFYRNAGYSLQDLANDTIYEMSEYLPESDISLYNMQSVTPEFKMNRLRDTAKALPAEDQAALRESMINNMLAPLVWPGYALQGGSLSVDMRKPLGYTPT